MLLVLRTPKVVTAQHCWGVLGLTGGARFARLLGSAGCCCWLPYLPLLALTCPYSPLLALTRPYHYSLLTTHYSLLSILSVSVFRCEASDPGE